ncbi:type IV pilus biogenesis/stability protein PilW [Duganella sp. FT80W]|uniref:Type IV pilus biogenesis/stability protein PilW n=1 Tax=Duganella guangzhouensis TaxID=2666084 RepID=A0A6I2KY74_9BURK|nr:type IV pilus biogenesis/stability protein PilW [Duganella guangzhouensis]MRW89146.1 type IV pilus biogenesis/stability protein PilW [Duganella guangzhouensis]
MTFLAQRSRLSLVALCVAGALAGCASSGSNKAELTTTSDATAVQRKVDIRMQLAIGYFQQGQYSVALDEVKMALAADPNYADGYGMRGLIYQQMGEIALAEDNFVRARKLAPSNPELDNNYGSFLCQTGRAKEALPLFDAALKNRAYRSPASAANNAGSCALKIKDYASAERYLLQALQLTPDLPATNTNLARVYVEKGDYVRANFFITRLNKVAKMESLTADVLWLAIKVQHKLGDKDAEAGWATQLRRHHAGSAEYAAYQRGAFDE